VFFKILLTLLTVFKDLRINKIPIFEREGWLCQPSLSKIGISFSCKSLMTGETGCDRQNGEGIDCLYRPIASAHFQGWTLESLEINVFNPVGIKPLWEVLEFVQRQQLFSKSGWVVIHTEMHDSQISGEN